MFCSKCGNQINQGERFCSSCGNSIEVVESIQPKIEIPKPPVTKKPINKKVLIPIAVIVSILVIGLIALVAYLGATAPQREMKKALESNNPYIVLETFDNLMADGEYGLAHEMIVDYINEATDNLNNTFTLSVDVITDDDEIYEKIMQFLYDNYGNMFVSVTENGTFNEKSGLCDFYNIDPFYEYESSYSIVKALDNLYSMIESKYQYFEGLYELDPSFKDDDYYYMNALDSFAGVIEEDINYEAAQEKAKEVCDEYINSLIAKADEYIAMGDYSAAVELLNYTILDEEELGVDTNLKAKFDEVLSTYAEQYVAKAEEEFKNGDVNAAIGNIEAAISIYPNGEYEAKLEEYKLYLPFELYNNKNALEYYGYPFGHETIISNNNVEMTNCLSYSPPENDDGVSECEDSAIYKLDGKYDVVTGTIFISAEEKNEKHIGYFEVYGDGKLIYTSPKTGRGILPQDFSFSVKGVQTLEIKYCGHQPYMYWPSEIYISNFVAKKNIPE